jgi:hypothetical protein
MPKKKPTLRKRVKKSEPVQKKEKGLNLKQELFCSCFTDIGKETFGNSTLSYIKAYGLDKEDERDYNTASAN